jgi:transposase
MSKPRHNYDLEFKKQLVRLRVEEGRTYPSLIQEYGISKASLRNWVNQYSEECECTPSLAKDDENLIKENKRLRKQLEEKEKEVRFLKKAAAFFAKEQD